MSIPSQIQGSDFMSKPIIEKKESFRAPQKPIKSSWNESRLVMRGPLTDKKIEQYKKQGWYSAELKRKRRELIEQKNAMRREGNWLVTNDGRSVYSPR